MLGVVEETVRAAAAAASLPQRKFLPVAACPAAIAALRERVEHTPAAAGPVLRADTAEDPTVLSTGLRRALAAHSLAGHRVHQLSPALLTVTLDAAAAQALAVLLAARRGLPRQAPAAKDELHWGAGPAKTAAASLAVALPAYGPGTYARALASGQVTAGLSQAAAGQVTAAMNPRPAPAVPASRARRRGLANGWKGIDAGR